MSDVSGRTAWHFVGLRGHSHYRCPWSYTQQYHQWPPESPQITTTGYTSLASYISRYNFTTMQKFNTAADWSHTQWVWWSGVVVSALASINNVNQRWAQLVLRWVTVSEFSFRWGTFISVCNQPLMSTQPGHPFVGRCNEYQPKGDDALQLGSKGRYGLCVGGSLAGKIVWCPRYTWPISEHLSNGASPLLGAIQITRLLLFLQ